MKSNTIKSFRSTDARKAICSVHLPTEIMEEERAPLIEEIEELETDPDAAALAATPPNQCERHVRTKVPETEIHLYRRGQGPIDIFKSTLGGWDQDQLEVRDILHKYDFKSIYAFNTQSGRGVPIRFNPKNGRSFVKYKDGGVVYIDGEPKVCFSVFSPFICLGAWKITRIGKGMIFCFPIVWIYKLKFKLKRLYYIKGDLGFDRKRKTIQNLSGFEGKGGEKNEKFDGWGQVPCCISNKLL